MVCLNSEHVCPDTWPEVMCLSNWELAGSIWDSKMSVQVCTDTSWFADAQCNLKSWCSHTRHSIPLCHNINAKILSRVWYQCKAKRRDVNFLLGSAQVWTAHVSPSVRLQYWWTLHDMRSTTISALELQIVWEIQNWVFRGVFAWHLSKKFTVAHLSTLQVYYFLQEQNVRAAMRK